MCAFDMAAGPLCQFVPKKLVDLVWSEFGYLNAGRMKDALSLRTTYH